MTSAQQVSGDVAARTLLEVCQADLIADGVRRVLLRHPNGLRLPDWAPGSHIDIALPGQLIRQYSLCGDRWDPFTYQIAVLREQQGRGGSAYVHDALAVGDLVPVGVPRNNFGMVPATRYLFIAGGIGITPLWPMVVQAEMLGADWSMIYGGRSRRSMAFLEALAAFGDRVRVWPRDEYGHLPLAEVFAAEPADAKIYCCGPSPLLNAVEELGTDRAPGTVRVERFTSDVLPAPARTDGFDVVLTRSDITIRVGPETSILDAAAEAGVRILSSCRQGVCGTCEVTVLDGVPDHRDALLTASERGRGDCMLPCVSRACSDRLVLEL